VSTPEIRASGPALTLGAWANVCVAFIHGALDIADVQIVSKVYEAMAQENPSGFLTVVVTSDINAMPADSARKAVAELMRGMEKKVLGMIGIVETTGFRGAAIRSIMTAMTMISRAPYPTKISSSLAEAAPWMSRYVRPSVKVDVLMNNLNHLKALARARAP